MIRNRVTFAMVTILLCLLCVFVISSCNGDTVCQHRDADDNALCDHCGESYTDGGEALHAHTFGPWSETVPATCSAAGTISRSCPCGDTETRSVEATNYHDFTQRVMTAEYVHTASTCRTPGIYYYKCTGCSAKGSETFEGDSVGDHSFTFKADIEAFLKSKANCDSPALYYYKCKWCNAKGENTYAVGSEDHNFAAQEQTAAYLKSEATCQARAEYYYKCTRCDKHSQATYRIGPKTKHQVGEDHICTGCSKAYIYFGEYPQSIKAEDVTITEIQDSRGYYLGSDNAYYAKVTASPYHQGYTFSTGPHIIRGMVYYFKVEPILWRIISQSDGTAIILCDSIIDNQTFDSESNNYADSDIRAWLNEQFYYTAFNDLERELIVTTTVENSAVNTDTANNSFVSENTEDRVFLLSYDEVRRKAYGFSTATVSDRAREMLTSDYSRAKGAYMSMDTAFQGNGSWSLRSPGLLGPSYIYNVIDGGNIFYCPPKILNGVVPALQIRLL